ncbi:MAG: HAMP domain-containing protein [Rhizobiales bacterium]|nr:HAMP domain-containing protein [Hyphomicrobiales bacterium]
MFWQSLTHSIGTKIFAAFIAMSAMIGGLGYYSVSVLEKAGDIIVKTYDGPLMSINYARSASLTFLQMQKVILESPSASEFSDVSLNDRLNAMSKLFYEDLEVARARSTAEDELRVIVEIKSLMDQWNEIRHSSATPKANPDYHHLGEKIISRFEVLVELNAGNSFVDRRKAIDAIGGFETSGVLVTLLALMAALALTLWLRHRIIRPLTSAADVADRIAGGQLEVDIPEGGYDETGVLLRSMRVMRDNIQDMVDREKRQRLTAESRLIDALENAREGMMLLDENNRLVIANRELGHFFEGFESHCGAGTAASDIADFIRPYVADTDDARFQSIYDRFLAREPMSAELLLKDGRALRLEASPTGDHGYIFLLGDFTDVKLREEALRKAKQSAETASEAKSNFLANMSHELRTPLNAIIGFSEIISGQVFGKLENARYLDYATDIMNSGRHLLGVINNVLELSRGQAGKMSIEEEDVDLYETLQQCLPMLREQCKDAELTLNVETRTEPLMILGETGKLRQIFLNLLSNAIKFSEAGGRIDVVFERDAQGRIVTRISDTGIGMSAEDIDVAMTPFGQVDSRLARRYEGTGLGLPLTKTLVDLHKGVMEIESTPERGTTVILRFTPLNEVQRQSDGQRHAS